MATKNKSGRMTYLEFRKRERQPLLFTKPTMTKQSHKDECDINNIMAKYKQHGIVTHVNRHQGNYADLTALPDYQEALNKVIEAEYAFSSLPAVLRKRFDNDPGAFLDFVADENNRSEMMSLGLLKSEASEAHNPLSAVASEESPAEASKSLKNKEKTPPA